MCVCMYIHMYTPMCIHVCIKHIYMYIYTHTHIYIYVCVGLPLLGRRAATGLKCMKLKHARGCGPRGPGRNLHSTSTRTFHGHQPQTNELGSWTALAPGGQGSPSSTEAPQTPGVKPWGQSREPGLKVAARRRMEGRLSRTPTERS